METLNSRLRGWFPAVREGAGLLSHILEALFSLRPLQMLVSARGNPPSPAHTVSPYPPLHLQGLSKPLRNK